MYQGVGLTTFAQGSFGTQETERLDPDVVHGPNF